MRIVKREDFDIIIHGEIREETERLLQYYAKCEIVPHPEAPHLVILRPVKAEKKAEKPAPAPVVEAADDDPYAELEAKSAHELRDVARNVGVDEGAVDMRSKRKIIQAIKEKLTNA